MVYSESIKRPFQDFTKFAIGVIVMLIPIVNITIGMGYVFRSAKLSMKKKMKLPEWEDWGDLFKTGLVAMVISAIWQIPTFLIAAVAGGAALVNASTALANGSIGSAFLSGFGIATIGIAIIGISAVVFSLLGAAGIFRYLESGNFSKAFEFNAIRKVGLRGEFFIAWLLGAIYFLIVSAVLSFIPVIGSAAGLFIGSITLWTILSRSYRK